MFYRRDWTFQYEYVNDGFLVRWKETKVDARFVTNFFYCFTIIHENNECTTFAIFTLEIKKIKHFFHCQIAMNLWNLQSFRVSYDL